MSPQVNHNLTTEGRRDADHYEYWLSRVPASGSETDTTCQIGYTPADYASASVSPLLVPGTAPLSPSPFCTCSSITLPGPVT
jgi:hypothetical protein